MLFSFVVPVYNTSQYLDRCMESLLSQKGADYEIFLIDDGSTDNSGKMCDLYTKQHPDIVRTIHKENEGSLLARHTGIINAHGDWIMCVDSDDYIDKDCLCQIINTIDRYHPDMIMFHYSYFDENGSIISAQSVFPSDIVFDLDNKEVIYEKRLTTNKVNSMCLKAIKNTLVDYSVDYHNCRITNMCDDAIQVLPLFTKASRIVYINKVLYYYRKGHGSTTSRQDWERWRSIKECFFETEKYLDIWSVSIITRQKFYTHHLEELSNYLRWVFKQSNDCLPISAKDIVHSINNHAAFQRCLDLYRKEFARTWYLKICVPMIMNYVQKENVKGLQRFFSFEKFLFVGRN